MFGQISINEIAGNLQSLCRVRLALIVSGKTKIQLLDLLMICKILRNGF
jgi:hypothetical protein